MSREIFDAVVVIWTFGAGFVIGYCAGRNRREK